MTTGHWPAPIRSELGVLCFELRQRAGRLRSGEFTRSWDSPAARAFAGRIGELGTAMSALADQVDRILSAAS